MTEVEEIEHHSKWIDFLAIIVVSLLFPIVVLSKILLIISYIFIPRSITELVPALNIQRKYLLYLSTILASKEKKELANVQETVDDILLKQEKIRDAYPIQRSVGELFDKFSTFSLFVLLPLFVWKQPFLEKFSYIHPLILILVFSTVQGMLSAITASFGPFFKLFHKMSMIMLKYKAYRAAYYYQKLEDIFALPFLASRSSYRFIDAPPISKETYEDFKIDLHQDVDAIKRRVMDFLNIYGANMSKETQELFNQYLSKIDQERLDMHKIEDSIARAFALLIWKRQSSFFPWKKNPAIKQFAKNNNLTYKEAKKALSFIANKLKDKFVSDEFYNSILLTGSLRGIYELEKKYNIDLSDNVFSQIAFSLALGGQRYILDFFTENPWYVKILIFLRNTIIFLLGPVLAIVEIFIDYIKHIKSETQFFLSKTQKNFLKIYVKTRFKEMKREFIKKLTKKESKDNEKLQIQNDKKGIIALINILKLLVQIVLALPLSLYYIGRALISIFRLNWLKKKTDEEITTREFEKELATSALASMYQEIYDKLVLNTYYFS
ncbi:MAG: hypothetical protein ACTSSL_11805 [Candidatus Heimdallarchaeaceae archaeon]